ncbi:hypothetical protein Adeh_3624 [Anaeromyxobacter dehalogenans 2CP-C]|uniref:Uncharacterized protein n=1 Tax=Anaeromyxobacter dehalogenans (strain 2CP-C) TaxID=290397 RepID=Q2IFM9_ANADE|nr:hypothetical protein Adeh_3624 [Anaeromyxobacter dehalogenans 2CP-C]
MEAYRLRGAASRGLRRDGGIPLPSSDDRYDCVGRERVDFVVADVATSIADSLMTGATVDAMVLSLLQCVIDARRRVPSQDVATS